MRVIYLNNGVLNLLEVRKAYTSFIDASTAIACFECSDSADNFYVKCGLTIRAESLIVQGAREGLLDLRNELVYPLETSATSINKPDEISPERLTYF